MECSSSAKASRWHELACINEVAASLVGIWEDAREQPEARALPCEPLGVLEVSTPLLGTRAITGPFLCYKRDSDLEDRIQNSFTQKLH